VNNPDYHNSRTGLADIGGRRLCFVCAGQGAPTIVLETGIGDTSATWSSILPAVAQLSTVCCYDRAGMGESDPAPIPRTCQDMAADLRALLAAIPLAPPYVLVGHSYGGMNVRLFASRYPDEVAGMVLIDAVHEDKDIQFESVLAADLIARHRAYLADPSRNSEHVDKPQCTAQLRAARCTFEFPIVVLARGLPDEPSPVWPSAAIQRVETELQREFLKLSPRSTHIIAEHSGHYIQHDQPDLVIEAIRQVVSLVR